MRIWDLKQGTSLHVLKGREEVNHLGSSLTGERLLPVGSDLCLSGEVALLKSGGNPVLNFPVPQVAVLCYWGGGRAGEAGGCRRVGFKANWVSLGRTHGAHASPACSPGQDGHQDPLTCVASNQDGSLIMTGSVDCHAKLVNSATGKVGLCGWGQEPRVLGDQPPKPCPGPSWCLRVVRASTVPEQPVLATNNQQEAPLANTTASSCWWDL